MSTSYIGRLPVELLEAVFLQCITVKGVPDPLLAPLLLCQVCSMWRVVAMDLPELWDTLSVRLPDPASHENCVSTANIMHFWLKNSGTAVPLVFSFRYRQLSDMPPPNLSFMDSIVASYSGRFRNLELKVQSNSVFHRLLSLPRGSLKLLETLVLDLNHFDPASTAFRDAPLLRRLNLSVHSCTYTAQSLPRPSLFPWGQLTHLTLNGNPVYDLWRDMFRQCLRLEYCSLCIVFAFTGLPDADYLSNSSYGEDDANPLRFPHLTVLKCAEMQDFALSLYGFSFPALTTLEVRDSDCSEDAHWIPNMTQHCGLPLCNLRRLSFRNNVLSATHVLGILHATTSLVDFEFAVDATMYYDFAELLWRELTLVAGDDPSTQLIARLEILNLWIFTSPLVPDSFTEALSNMIESRWMAPLRSPGLFARLQKVSLEFHATYSGASEMAEEVRGRLESCRLEGLTLYVESAEGEEEEEDYEEVDWRNASRW